MILYLKIYNEKIGSIYPKCMPSNRSTYYLSVILLQFKKKGSKGFERL